jgi:hypothetical protein
MKRAMCSAIFLLMATPVFAQSPKAFDGTWKSTPGTKTPTMTRKLVYRDHMIVMTELQPARDGRPGMTIYREYPTAGNTVTMHTGVWDGAVATGKMENGVLTVDTTMKNGTKFKDVWILSKDRKQYTDKMTITGSFGRPGAAPSNNKGPRTINFSFSKVD